MADLPDSNALSYLGSDPPMPSEVTRYVGARIAHLREDAGLSQRDFARMLGVKQPTVANWETGKREMDLAQLVAVANALDVPLATLLPVRAQDVDRLRRWLDSLERG